MKKQKEHPITWEQIWFAFKWIVKFALAVFISYSVFGYWTIESTYKDDVKSSVAAQIDTVRRIEYANGATLVYKGYLNCEELPVNVREDLNPDNLNCDISKIAVDVYNNYVDRSTE